MASRADELKELLLSLTLRVREIRGLSLIDGEGLPLVSTLGAPALEEALTAFGGSMVTQMERAQKDFEMGPIYVAHIVGRDRQIFLAPVRQDVTLIAIVDAHATPTTITMHLLALARQVLPWLWETESS
jgi:predicted regulator of Ras-like GTPase activity (Roadblock/LC7/MglB family)